MKHGTNKVLPGREQRRRSSIKTMNGHMVRSAERALTAIIDFCQSKALFPVHELKKNSILKLIPLFETLPYLYFKYQQAILTQCVDALRYTSASQKK